jgi:hypothetical protein
MESIPGMVPGWLEREKLETRKQKLEGGKEKLESREEKPHLPRQEPGKGGECGDFFEASAMVSSEASNDGHRGPSCLPSLNSQRLKLRSGYRLYRIEHGLRQTRKRRRESRKDILDHSSG